MDLQSVHCTDSRLHHDGRPLHERHPVSSQDTRRRHGNRVVADLRSLNADTEGAGKAFRVPPQLLSEHSTSGDYTIKQMLQRIFAALIHAAQYPGTCSTPWLPDCQDLKSTWHSNNAQPLHNSSGVTKLLSLLGAAARSADFIIGTPQSTPANPSVITKAQ